LKTTITLFISLLIFFNVFGESKWTAEFQGGIVYSVPLPLTIYQSGYSEIRIDKARYQTKPLELPIYWALRIGRWWDNKSVEFEFIHQKFYLINKPAEVQHFEMTHGYNMFMFNHARDLEIIIVRAGLGSVLLHTESTIREMEYPSGKGIDLKGYKLRGIVFHLAIARRLNINERLFINTEFKVNASFANAPIVNGYAKTNILVFQLTVGLGYKW
jgi:hypothetical protein